MSHTFEKLYLVAPTESDLIAALSISHEIESGETITQNRFYDGDDWVVLDHDWAIEPIGPIKVVDVTRDPETGHIATSTVLADDDRFHLNIRCTQDVAAWITAKLPASMIVTPETPLHTWSD